MPTTRPTRMTRKTRFAAALALAALAPLSVANAADVGTTFTDGGGSATPDQFVGTAGDGWLSAWSGSGGTSSTVTNTTPVAGGGNYLSSARNAAGNATLRREFDPTHNNLTGLDPHTIQWDWRFDGDLGQFTTFNDRVHFFGDSSNIAGSTNTNSWLLGVVGADRASAGNFYIYDNAGSSPGSFDDPSMINTGIALAEGSTYRFTLIVDPVDGTYDATIRDLTGGTNFTAANNKFRNAQTGVGSTTHLHFGSSASGVDDTTFSLDSIAITHRPAIVANFSDGNDPNTIDSFPGTAGGGWTGGWTTSGVTATVSTADPLNAAGDPYLQVTAVSPAGGNQENEIRRQFEDFGRVDVNSFHKVSWQWRLDGNVADLIDSGDDRIHFYADNDDSAGTNNTNAWLIGVTGDRSSSGFVDGDFYFYDGTLGNGFTGANTVQTGITLAEDVTYFFEVWVNPLTKMYDARITDEFGNTFFASDLGFRNLLTGTGGVTWNRLHFGASVNGANDDLSFSIDSITIQAIPTPTAAGAGLVGLIALTIARPRRRPRNRTR